ncbi:HEPN domain-containing protein [Pseudoflavitalea sp. G-6-1-2]|uniref:HEPN domain-containing protein n=1 Tax=Pseudoflavitalea sp. G-6-1-2 TaxID=2728841 RepID=UPI00146DD902|nr:HEPN domain-containing protein [Pseudoflavitalea sp. G-6-1-2]NML19733.1 HEPN domain-containing protein [Pseudoflavitalea sp. G-6-1-2]
MLKYQSSGQLNGLVAQLRKKIAVDKIFLLGVTAADLPVNSIFHPYDHEEAQSNGYFLLVLTQPSEKRCGDTVQDILEQTRFTERIHTLVYPSRLFQQWLGEGQSFAVRVAEQAPLLFNLSSMPVRPPVYFSDSDWRHRSAQLVEQGYHRSKMFLTGAKIFEAKKEYSLAAFLMHQATEHACITFILQFTGLKTSTHNLDKLLRYTTLISNQVSDHFPRQTRQDRELFRLLQKAYVHSRYKSDYMLAPEQAAILLQRISEMFDCLAPEKKAGIVSEEQVPYSSYLFNIEQWAQRVYSSFHKLPSRKPVPILS